MFPAQPSDADDAAVAEGSGSGRSAQLVQADLPGSEQPTDSHGGREVLVSMRRGHVTRGESR